MYVDTCESKLVFITLCVPKYLENIRSGQLFPGHVNEKGIKCFMIGF